jgi:hypothetical protein
MNLSSWTAHKLEKVKKQKQVEKLEKGKQLGNHTEPNDLSNVTAI